MSHRQQLFSGFFSGIYLILQMVSGSWRPRTRSTLNRVPTRLFAVVYSLGNSFQSYVRAVLHLDGTAHFCALSATAVAVAGAAAAIS